MRTSFGNQSLEQTNVQIAPLRYITYNNRRKLFVITNERQVRTLIREIRDRSMSKAVDGTYPFHERNQCSRLS